MRVVGLSCFLRWLVGLAGFLRQRRREDGVRGHFCGCADACFILRPPIDCPGKLIRVFRTLNFPRRWPAAFRSRIGQGQGSGGQLLDLLTDLMALDRGERRIEQAGAKRRQGIRGILLRVVAGLVAQHLLYVVCLVSAGHVLYSLVVAFGESVTLFVGQSFV